jgi:hypothetical protein
MLWTRQLMLESIQAMSLLTIMEIVGPLLLAAALIYGTVRWSRRRATRTEAVREAATRRLYREAEQEELREQEPGLAGTAAATRPPSGQLDPATLGRLRSGRERERPSEDDIVQTHFGPRGVPGETAKPKQLDEAVTQIPKPLDPGHTA